MSNGYPGWENYQLPTTDTRPKRSKYRAEPTEVDGVRFASIREANRYQALKLEQRAGVITGLDLQPQFELHVTTPAGVRVTVSRYVADFRYVRDGVMVIEDAKGMRTPVYQLKKAHVEAEYGITVLET